MLLFLNYLVVPTHLNKQAFISRRAARITTGGQSWAFPQVIKDTNERLEREVKVNSIVQSSHSADGDTKALRE